MKHSTETACFGKTVFRIRSWSWRENTRKTLLREFSPPAPGPLGSPDPTARQDVTAVRSGRSLLQRSPPGQPQTRGCATRHPTLSPKTEGICSKAAVCSPHEGREGKGRGTSSERCCQNGSWHRSVSCPFHQRTGALLAFQPYFRHGLVLLSYLIEGLHRIKT